MDGDEHAPGSGTWCRQATSPAIYGSKRKLQIHSICDFHFSLECAKQVLIPVCRQAGYLDEIR